MKMHKVVSTAVTSLGLVVGMSGLAGATSGGGGAGSIHQTGWHSHNKVTTRTYSSVKVNNENNISVDNSNSQHAYTGDATVYHNTTGGSATTGDATNQNETSITAHVTNTPPAVPVWTAPVSGGAGSISDTGSHSYNTVESTQVSKVNVSNENNVDISNNNCQTAVSGDATVSHNTTGGNATTGDATNTNSTSINLSVSNN